MTEPDKKKKKKSGLSSGSKFQTQALEYFIEPLFL